MTTRDTADCAKDNSQYTPREAAMHDCDYRAKTIDREAEQVAQGTAG